MNTNLEMSVLDARGRYGLHPNWKSFTGELNSLNLILFNVNTTMAPRQSIEAKVLMCF